MPEARVIPIDFPVAEPDPPEPAAPGPADDSGEAPGWERRLAGALAFARRRITGDYPIDDFGFDSDLTDHVLLPLLRPLYEKYFRVEVRGIEHVPDEGGALIVANHSGTVPLDSSMTQLALHDHHRASRHLRMLGADLVFTLPLIAPIARKGGARWPATRTLSGCSAPASW
jgi:hypothetical protein